MRPALRWFLHAITIATAASLAACSETPSPVAPQQSAASLPPGVANSVTREHQELDFFQDADIFLPCINEMTHWEGNVHVILDFVTTPTGTVLTRNIATLAPDFFVERANGTRYYPERGRQHVAHIVEGRVFVVSGVEPVRFRSEDGDLLNAQVHWATVINPNGKVVVDKFTGVC